MTKRIPHVTPEVVDSTVVYNLEQFCVVCQIERELVVEMIEEGVVEPEGGSETDWIFTSNSVVRLQRAYRLQRDLQLNLPGAALSVDLLEEIDQLRLQLSQLKTLLERGD